MGEMGQREKERDGRETYRQNLGGDRDVRRKRMRCYGERHVVANASSSVQADTHRYHTYQHVNTLYHIVDPRFTRILQQSFVLMPCRFLNLPSSCAHTSTLQRSISRVPWWARHQVLNASILLTSSLLLREGEMVRSVYVIFRCCYHSL